MPQFSFDYLQPNIADPIAGSLNPQVLGPQVASPQVPGISPVAGALSAYGATKAIPSLAKGVGGLLGGGGAGAAGTMQLTAPGFASVAPVTTEALGLAGAGAGAGGLGGLGGLSVTGSPLSAGAGIAGLAAILGMGAFGGNSSAKMMNAYHEKRNSAILEPILEQASKSTLGRNYTAPIPPQMAEQKYIQTNDEGDKGYQVEELNNFYQNTEAGKKANADWLKGKDGYGGTNGDWYNSDMTRKDYGGPGDPKPSERLSEALQLFPNTQLPIAQRNALASTSGVSYEDTGRGGSGSPVGYFSQAAPSQAAPSQVENIAQQAEAAKQRFIAYDPEGRYAKRFLEEKGIGAL